MKHLFTALLAATLAAVHPLSSYAQDYKLVWSDEFDANTLGANWRVIDNDAPYNNELQAYTSRPENVAIEDGNLVITARREAAGSRRFTSGRIDSHGKVSFTHGRLEARIKMPRLAGGLWPAFWMMGEELGEGAWPKCGEIDIMEAGQSEAVKNGTQERTIAGTIHWGESTDKHKMYTPGNYTAPYDVTGDYHIFTMQWDDDVLSFYLDDSKEPYFTKSIKSGFSLSDYFHHPYYIIFNLAVGGDYTGLLSPSDITALPSEGDEAKMYVDYVRLYQKEGSENVTTGIRTVMSENKPHAANGRKGSYNMLGEAVSRDSMQHGVYIVDGRKMAIR